MQELLKIAREKQASGKIKLIGVHNLPKQLLEITLAIAEKLNLTITSNKLPLNLFDQKHVTNGTIDYCINQGIQPIINPDFPTDIHQKFPNWKKYNQCRDALELFATLRFHSTFEQLNLALANTYGIPIIKPQTPEQFSQLLKFKPLSLSTHLVSKIQHQVTSYQT